MSTKTAVRGEVWIVDLGLAAKIRPCLVVSVPLVSSDRVLVTLVPRTTSIQGTRFEVPASASFFKDAGVFDAQQIITIPQAKLVRRLGQLKPDQFALVLDAVRNWLGI